MSRHAHHGGRRHRAAPPGQRPPRQPGETPAADGPAGEASRPSGQPTAPPDPRGEIEAVAGQPAADGSRADTEAVPADARAADPAAADARAADLAAEVTLAGEADGVASSTGARTAAAGASAEVDAARPPAGSTHEPGTADQPVAAAGGPSGAPEPMHPALRQAPVGSRMPAGRAPGPSSNADGQASGCTAPQLRRFIKSRAYVPMHELRRRFGIEGGDDEVTMVEVGGTRVYVGLPSREGRLLGELLQAGDVGYELSMDPITPIVVGLFPMRPVPRS